MNTKQTERSVLLGSEQGGLRGAVGWRYSDSHVEHRPLSGKRVQSAKELFKQRVEGDYIKFPVRLTKCTTKAMEGREGDGRAV